jgi:hypothetical protein
VARLRERRQWDCGLIPGRYSRVISFSKRLNYGPLIFLYDG